MAFLNRGRLKDEFRKPILYLIGIILISVLLLGTGYLTGRRHILGSARDFLQNQLIAETSVDLPQGAPDNVRESKTYYQLNRRLDERLLDLKQSSARWPILLETNSQSEQLKIVDELLSDYEDLLSYSLDSDPSLNAQKEFWFSRDGIDAYLVEFKTHPGVSLLSVLLVPQGITEPSPALLVLHGYQGNLLSVVSDIDYHHGFGFELAKNGFTILAPLRVASTINTHSTLKIKAMSAGLSLESINLHQLEDAIDYLDSLDAVDKQHIGVYGISLGGQHALRLGAMDPRLSMVVSSGYFTDRFAWLFQRESPYVTVPPGEEMTKHIAVIDFLYTEPGNGLILDDLNLVAMIQPRYLAVVSGNKDPRHNAAEAEFKKVKKLYDHFGYPERASFMPFDGGHETSVESVLPFLKTWVESEAVDFSK